MHLINQFLPDYEEIFSGKKIISKTAYIENEKKKKCFQLMMRNKNLYCRNMKRFVVNSENTYMLFEKCSGKGMKEPITYGEQNKQFTEKIRILNAYLQRSR